MLEKHRLLDIHVLFYIQVPWKLSMCSKLIKSLKKLLGRKEQLFYKTSFVACWLLLSNVKAKQDIHQSLREVLDNQI